MFTIPSIWNLVISTIVFFIAAWYINRYLDDQGIPKGMTRGMLIFVLASLLSWASGELIDWAQEKIEGKQPKENNSEAVSQLLKDANQTQP